MVWSKFGQLGLPINPVKPNESNKIKLQHQFIWAQAKFKRLVKTRHLFMKTINYIIGRNHYQQLGLDNGSTANVDTVTLVPAAHYGNQILESASPIR